MWLGSQDRAWNMSLHWGEQETGYEMTADYFWVTVTGKSLITSSNYSNTIESYLVPPLGSWVLFLCCIKAYRIDLPVVSLYKLGSASHSKSGCLLMAISDTCVSVASDLPGFAAVCWVFSSGQHGSDCSHESSMRSVWIQKGLEKNEYILRSKWLLKDCASLYKINTAKVWLCSCVLKQVHSSAFEFPLERIVKIICRSTNDGWREVEYIHHCVWCLWLSQFWASCYRAMTAEISEWCWTTFQKIKKKGGGGGERKKMCFLIFARRN